MPLYFAYGANLDRPAMARRCPASRPLDAAQLPAYRFFVMDNGYASVRPGRNAVVHGLLWDLAPRDLPALDDFEEVGAGLYERRTVAVRTVAGAVDALIYRGCSDADGVPCPGYMEAVIAAGTTCGLPAAYLEELRSWLPRGLATGR